VDHTIPGRVLTAVRRPAGRADDLPGDRSQSGRGTRPTVEAGTSDPVERVNRTLATKWAYSPAWTSNAGRDAAVPAWLPHYNLGRPHLGIGELPPIDRVNNAAGQYS
jgi:transposase InsO family protein